MHIYVFGSLCRGELDLKSDVDILIISDDQAYLEYNDYSVYSYNKVRELWIKGNPFAWHLYLESKLVFSNDGCDFLRSLGEPNKYSDIKNDFYKFKEIYECSIRELSVNYNNVFNLSCIFLSIRNIATCYSLYLGKPIFSRLSMIKISLPLDVPVKVIEILEKCRILSTRGVGDNLTELEFEMVVEHLDSINKWFDKIEVSIHEG